MTLILSAILGPYIIQVSDRRLTLPNGSIFDDEANKAIFLEGRMAMAYTGLASINNQRTDKWLAQALLNSQTPDLGSAMNYLSEKATQAFKILPRSLSNAQRRTAFIAVGWVLLKEDGGFPAPIFCSISNSLDSNFNWLPNAESKFSVRSFIGPANIPIYFLKSSGQNIDLITAKKLLRTIKRCGEHMTGPEPVARLLVEQIYRTADRNHTVGKSLIITCVPRNILFSENNFFLNNLAPKSPLTEKENASFRYLSAKGEEATQYSPIYVRDGSAFTLEATRLNDTGSDQDITLTRLFPK